MKKIIALVAVVAMTACGTTPRNPTDIGSSIKGSSDGSSVAVNATAELSVKVFNASVNSVASTAEKVGGGAKSTFNFSKNMTVKAVGFSGKSATFVFEHLKSASEKTSEVVADGARFVVTSTGDVVKSSVNVSKKTVKTTIEFASSTAQNGKEATLIVWNSAKNVIFGSATITGNMASKVANWISTGVEFSVNQSGNLVKDSADGSSEVIGTVYDSSKTVIGFVVDAAGNIFTFSKNTSVAVVTSSADAVVNFGQDLWSAMRTTGSASVDLVKSSAKGSVVILKASGKAVAVSSASISDALGFEKY